MKVGITVTQSRRGTSVRATGFAAQALFDALTKPQPVPQPAPAEPPASEPASTKPLIQIGPTDC